MHTSRTTRRVTLCNRGRTALHKHICLKAIRDVEIHPGKQCNDFEFYGANQKKVTNKASSKFYSDEENL